MENIKKEYQVKIGATGKYMQVGNNRDTEKFLAAMEGRKIYVHGFDEEEDDFSEIWISQYEKTSRFKIPAELLEEYIEENELEGDENKFDYIEFIKKNKKALIAGFIILIIFLFFSVDLKSLKANTMEAKQEKTIFQVLSDREVMLNQKEDLELQEQKQLREKLSASKKKVEEIRIQKTEIAKQKIEAAQ